jgi:succinoglycan biosynthesis transport protein ExoP
MSALRPSGGFRDELQTGGLPIEAPAVPVRAMPHGSPPQTFFNLDLLRALQLHRALAVGIFVVAVALAAAYMARGWNHYTAETLVYVQPNPPRLLDSGQTQHWPYDANTYESYIQQQIHNVTRPDVLTAAVHKMPDWKNEGETDQAAAARLDRAIEVVRVGASYQVSITAKARNAVEAAQMANAVAASFIESATRELRSGDTQRIQLLRDERDRIFKELASDRAEQEDLNKKLGIAAVAGATPDPYDEQIAAVRGELVKARTANDEAAARLTSLAKVGASSAALDAEADEIVSSDAGMVAMKTALNKRRSDLISQMANLTPNHPQYKQDTEELAKINTSLDAIGKDLRDKASSHIQQRLKNDLERTSAVESKLNSQLAQLTGAAGSATPRLQRSNELATDIVRLQNRFAVVDEQFRNLTMEANAPGAVYVASAATPPLSADHAKTFRNGFIVIVLGLVLGLGAALLAHNVDPHIYVAKDVEQILGFAPMAMLPDFREVSSGVADEYMLRLAAAVEHAYQEGAMKSCIFTGVAPGAGATTLATKVTDMLQAMGRETVLVDAAGVPSAEFSGVQFDSTDLVAAPRGTRSTALLQRVTNVTSGDSIVVTDTAPLLVSGETEYLARFVDSAVVVIESGVTTRSQLRDLARTLQRLEVSAVGFVLNRVSLTKANASFRESVHAVEQHLHAQARSFARNTARTQQPQSQWDTHAEPRVARNRHKTEAMPQPMDEETPADRQRIESLRETDNPAPSAPERGRDRSTAHTQEPQVSQVHMAKPAEAATPRSVDASEPVVSTGRIIPPAPARDAAAPPRRAEAAPTITAHRFITPEPTVDAQPAPVGGARSAGPALWSATPVEPVHTPVAPKETVAPAGQPQPVQAHMPRPPIAQQTPRGREPKRQAPPSVDPNVVDLPPAPVVERPRPAWPSPTDLRVEPPIIPAAPVLEATRTAAAPGPAASQFVGGPADAPAKFGSDWVPPESSGPVIEPVPQHRQEAPQIEGPGTAPTQWSYRAQEPVPAVSAPLPQPPALAEDSDELPYSAASRLGGLRTLLVSLGLKALNKESEFHGEETDLGERHERNAERPVYAEPVSVSPSRGAEALAPDAASVKATPEFLPPKPALEATTEREKDAVRPVPKRLRWDDPQDVETLPSWRGQYRKRR